ncbi:MAG: hypothetical protein KC468_01030 [Myxococcales bacterium]|nr:hypothetical protein [Myxococcales bacterium]
MQEPERVVDETGAEHVLERCIGRGGQGRVWLTAGGRRIVKLLPRRRDPEALRRQLAFVRRLDLRGLHVAKPLALLKSPRVGYVAEFLTGMAPIASLISAPRSGLGQWWNDETGGLRRRLRVLAHAGEALAGLHGRGVIYADLSHDNVFVSASTSATEAWLIDLDNLSHSSDPCTAIYTPWYGAPELVNNVGGCTTLSDAWSFAVLVYSTLTLTHPLIGDYVSEGEPELEEEALAGRLPWVGCTTDQRNYASTGIPAFLTMGRKLNELARKTFEDGVNNRRLRPGVAEWVARLHAAADQTVTCPGCGASYFVNADVCPWCDEEPRPRLVRVDIARWQPHVGLVAGTPRLGVVPLTDTGVRLPLRITRGLSGVSARELHVALDLAPRGVI